MPKSFSNLLCRQIILQKEAQSIRSSTLFKGVVEQFEELMSDLQIFVKDKIEMRLFEEINYMIHKEKTKLKTNKDNLENNMNKLRAVFVLKQSIRRLRYECSQFFTDRFVEPVDLEVPFMDLIQSKLRHLLAIIVSRKEKNNSEEQFELFRNFFLLDYHVK
ncbi:hypothetical protein CEXT_769561 [Caerostris extrusa]|uniref:Uncharacterized protein n=1 Tax=Caerostris extrusa TaxID=172846 RepID=A0AAV4U371_CAEEX|nr:hypothetical protein CEXT_769561 [Caerostris extrusa]